MSMGREELTSEVINFALRWSRKRLAQGTGTLLRSKIGAEQDVTVVARNRFGGVVGISVAVFENGVTTSSITVVAPPWQDLHIGRGLLRLKSDILLGLGIRLDTVVGATNIASMKMTGSVLREVGVINEGPRGPRVKFTSDNV